jgi:hypothetical protein
MVIKPIEVMQILSMCTGTIVHADSMCNQLAKRCTPHQTLRLFFGCSPIRICVYSYLIYSNVYLNTTTPCRPDLRASRASGLSKVANCCPSGPCTACSASAKSMPAPWSCARAHHDASASLGRGLCYLPPRGSTLHSKRKPKPKSRLKHYTLLGKYMFNGDAKSLMRSALDSTYRNR